MATVIIIATSSNAVTLGKKMNPLTNDPYFTIKLNASGSSYFIELNGASVHNELDNDGQLSTEFPVNHWMRSGKNTLTLQVIPEEEGAPFNPASSIEVELLVAPNNNKEQTFSIASILFEGSNASGEHTKNSSKSGSYDDEMKSSTTGSLTISDITETAMKDYKGALIFKRELNIINTLPLWNFFTSDDLPKLEPLSDEEYYKLLDSLLFEYSKVQNAIETSSIDEIIPLFKERNSELDAAFYYSPGTMENKIRTSLIEASNNQDLELVPLKQQNVDFTIESNNKLVSLTRESMAAAVTLNFKSGYGSQRYNMIFRRKDNEWILAR